MFKLWNELWKKPGPPRSFKILQIPICLVCSCLEAMRWLVEVPSKIALRVNNSNKTFFFIYFWSGFTFPIKDARLQEVLWKASLPDTATLSSTLETSKTVLFDLNLKINISETTCLFKYLKGHLPEISSEFSTSMMERREEDRFAFSKWGS